MLTSSSDYLLRGALLGLVLEAALAALATLAAGTFTLTEDWRNIAIWLFAATSGGLATLLWRPVALLTLWKAGRSPFVLDEDVRAMVLGRIIGIVLGLGFGITLAVNPR